jgi:hypothetical protein
VAPKLLTDADWAAELLTLAGFDAVVDGAPGPRRCAGFAYRYIG